MIANELQTKAQYVEAGPTPSKLNQALNVAAAMADYTSQTVIRLERLAVALRGEEPPKPVAEAPVLQPGALGELSHQLERQNQNQTQVDHLLDELESLIGSRDGGQTA